MGLEVGSITTNPIASSDPIARDRILLKNFKCAQFLTPSGIGSGIKPTFFHLISITTFVEQRDKQDKTLGEIEFQSGWRDLNPRPLVPQLSAGCS